MDEEEAKEYLARKDKPVTKENIAMIMKKGKIYGDPLIEMSDW